MLFTKHNIHNGTMELLTIVLLSSFYLLSSPVMSSSVLSVAAMLLTVIIAFYYGCEDGGKLVFRLQIFHVLYIVFILYCYLSALWAIRPSLAISKGNTLVKNFFCISLLLLCYQKEMHVKSLLKIVMYCGYLMTLLSVAFFGVDGLRESLNTSERLNNSFINTNTLGMVAGYSIIITVYFYVYFRKYKWTLLLALIAMVVLAAAGSRKSIIELALGFCILFTLRFYKKNTLNSILKILFALIAFAAIGYFLLNIPMFHFLKTRLNNVIHHLMGSGATDESVKGRAALNILGIKLFLEHPILGIGMDCARIPALKLTGHDWYLHNNYLELLADGGIMGLLGYYSFYIYFLSRFIKYRKCRDAGYDICLTLLIVRMVLEFAFVAYYERDNNFYFMIFFVETEILNRRNKNFSILSVGKMIQMSGGG